MYLQKQSQFKRFKDPLMIKLKLVFLCERQEMNKKP
jgi:hypothetical protein